MVEPAGVLSVATAGFKLAITLYSLAEAIGSIDTEIRRTAMEISLFSDVLHHLVDTLKRGQDVGYITEKALETVQGVIIECRKIFQDLEMMIEKSTKSEEVITMRDDEIVIEPKLRVPLAGRFLYFFQKSKVETLRRQLESLKVTLSLWLGTVSIAEKFEEARKRKPEDQPECEIAQTLSGQDYLKMRCLVLANEAAAAEVRKHTRTKTKNTKERNKDTKVPEPRLSIASEGVFWELPKRSLPKNSEGLVSKSSDKMPSNDGNSLTYSPTAAAEKDPEESKILVDETSQVVLALLALWVSNGAQFTVNEQSKTSTKDKWKYEERTVEQQEQIDLFPKRESMPCSAAKEQGVEEEPIDLFPRRPPRPY